MLQSNGMFFLAVLPGLYGYAILILGLGGWLKVPILAIVNLGFFLLLMFLVFRYFSIHQSFSTKLPLDKKTAGLILLLVLIALLHLIGALGPEIYYDALWYHLTLPKLYLSWGAFRFIPGNLYYYSAMPQLGELIYTGVLPFVGEIGVKVVHYCFGLMTSLVIIAISKRWFSLAIGMGAALIFMSDLSVAWLMSTANIDLIRTYFECLSLGYFYMWYRKSRPKSLIQSGIMAGFALATKYFAFINLAVIAILILMKEKRVLPSKSLFLFVLPSFFVSIFWFIRAFYYTGNPLYPMFTMHLSEVTQSLRPLSALFFDFFALSNASADWLTPLSPLFVMSLPLLFIRYRYQPAIKPLILYVLLCYVGWFFIPRLGGTRFIVAFLPVLSLITLITIVNVPPQMRLIRQFFFVFIGVLWVAHVSLRTYVNSKYVPVLLGYQSKQEFLTHNLDFTHAFFDVDGEVTRLLTENPGRVLVVGGHNLYYVPTPFVHYSFATTDRYRYILTQHASLPSTLKGYGLIYSHPQTHVSLYQALE